MDTGTAYTSCQSGLLNLTEVQGGEIHLYAQWTDLASSPYIVTVNFNDGTTANGTIEVLPGTSAELPAPTRTGYTFEGWFLDDAPITTISEDTIQDDCTVTARWTPHQYIVIYDLNGADSVFGEAPPAVRVCTYDQPMAIPLGVPKKSPYTFRGWAVSLNSKEYYHPGEVVKNLTTEPGAVVTL